MVKDVPLGDPDTDMLHDELAIEPPNLVFECPLSPASQLCHQGRGNFTWYKDSLLLPGHDGNVMRIVGGGAFDEGIYSCVCTWRYGNQTYNLSASFRLTLKTEGYSVRHPPTIRFPLNGSSQSCHLVDNYVSWTSVTITLEQHVSMLPVLVACVSVFLLLILVAMAIRCFYLDLSLHFRRPRTTEDGKAYDAYVVYPRERVCACECVCEQDVRCVCVCPCEEALSAFLNSTLPAVLEENCGYTLYIHGRDDTPGEDQAEAAERSIRLSRRLLVVMPTLEQAPPLEACDWAMGFDWQLGVHSALVTEDIRVIVVQVARGHTHVPAGLQLLLRKSAPLRWRMGSRRADDINTHFWKRLRYMMPAPPPRTHTHTMNTHSR
ncbi:interleukin-1 receptor-like 1 [Engraulis encrasicolus]|uniref:interleukin-1 receptor-like 1 n=1 Tax=Engraulis encrasicolus TaxID=184585 RepID=UPI002FD6D14E